MNVREAVAGDLVSILKLYTDLNDNPFPEIDDNVVSVWNDIMNNDYQHVIVVEESGRPVSTCEVIIIPNLTRKLRPFAVVENVVTASDCRHRGYASTALDFAKRIATEHGCSRLMLLTSHMDDATIRFYENAGYDRSSKIGFVQWLI